MVDSVLLGDGPARAAVDSREQVTAAVQTTSLEHRYGARTALLGVDLQVPAGTIFGILGPNGSGKTTLFKILTTLQHPFGGRATVAGFDVVKSPAMVRRELGVAFQHPSLDVRLTVAENLRHQGHLYGLRGPGLRHRMDELLERFQVGDRRSDLAGKLSGGLQRRVELAKAMLHRPSVLILDEPSTGLDPLARLSLFRQLEELRDREGMTILLTTHLMDEADRCDRVAIFDAGRLVTENAPAALKASVGGDVITVSARVADKAKGKLEAALGRSVQVVDGSLRIEHQAGPELVPRIAACLGDELESLHLGRPSLEDAFVHFTGHGFDRQVERTADGGQQ